MLGPGAGLEHSVERALKGTEETLWNIHRVQTFRFSPPFLLILRLLVLMLKPHSSCQLSHHPLSQMGIIKRVGNRVSIHSMDVLFQVDILPD